MRTANLTRQDQESLLSRLEEMPAFLEAALRGLSPEAAAVRGPENTFSPVEQCWHLADLEREGFGARIRRLLAEDDPALPDFDGERAAQQRRYRSLALEDGARALREARAENLAALRRVSGAGWTRTGTQDGVGRVALRDVPAMMVEHDASHRREIEAWLRAFAATPGSR